MSNVLLIATVNIRTSCTATIIDYESHLFTRHRRFTCMYNLIMYILQVNVFFFTVDIDFMSIYETHNVYMLDHI